MAPFPSRQAALLWARQAICDPTVVFLDTETTGVRPTDDVIDLAVIDSTGDVIFEQLFKPQIQIPSEVIAVHGITNRMVADAADLSEYHAAIQNLMQSRVVVAYNADFDRAMITAACARRGLPPIEPAGWVCAMEAYAAFNGEASWHRPGFRWMSLEKATRRLKIPKPTHRAVSDARACRAVVMALARMELEETVRLPR